MVCISPPGLYSGTATPLPELTSELFAELRLSAGPAELDILHDAERGDPLAQHYVVLMTRGRYRGYGDAPKSQGV